MILGIDAGGTYLRYELRDKNKIIESSSVRSSEISLREYIETILKNRKEIQSICISFAGQVKDGVIVASPNIDIDNFKIKEYFEEKFNLKLFIENDLNCAVLAESKAHNSTNICALYVGTGLGLGVLSSSMLIKGFSSVATELGHIPYRESPFTCGCGKSNCLELFASGVALEKNKIHYGISKSLTLNQLKNSTNIDEKKIYNEFIEALLHAVGTTITLFNPEVLLLGGGIIASNSDIVGILLSKIENYAMPIALKNIEIKNTQIKNASLEGAFLLKDYNV